MAMAGRGSRRLLQALAAGVVFAGGVVGVGSMRAPAGDAKGTALHGDALHSVAVAPEAICIASFNIHSGRNGKGIEDLTATAKTLEGFDLVGLEEVSDSVWPGTPPQVAILATDLNQQWLFAPTERQYWSERFGNGLLVRVPVSSWERIGLPSPKQGTRRNVLIARVPASGTTITVLVTHITRSEDQNEQLQFVTKLFEDQPAPTVLMGDLNATSKHPRLQELLSQPGIGNPLDEKIPRATGKHIDWIITRGLNTRDAGARDLGASDHPLVWAELAVAVPATRPSSAPAMQP